MGYLKTYKFEKLALLPLKFRLRKKAAMPAEVLSAKNKKVHFIIFYGGAIGDCVLATYFIAQLTYLFPACEVTFMGLPGASGLMNCLEEIDHVVPLEMFSIRKLSDLMSYRVWSKFSKETRAIKQHSQALDGYKVLISLNRMDSLLGAYKTRMVTSAVKYDVSIGLDTNNGRGAFFDHRIHDPGNMVEHLTQTWSGILSLLAQQKVTITPAIRCTMKRQNSTVNAFKSTAKYCVFHTGGGSDIRESKWLNKRWAIQNFYDVAQWVREKTGYDVVFVGTAGERDPSFDTFSNPHYIDLYGKTSLQELMLVISKAEFYLGNDSGIAHISSLLNIPTRVIWGYASHIDYGPISPNTKLIRLDLSCSPCLPFFDKRACIGTDWELKCVKGISQQYVKDEIGMLIGSKVAG